MPNATVTQKLLSLLEEEFRAPDSNHSLTFQRIQSLYEGFASDNQKYLPMVHLVFDDTGPAPCFVSTPHMNIMMNGEVERLYFITDTVINFPEVVRTIGSDLHQAGNLLFALSAKLNALGLGSLCELCEAGEEAFVDRMTENEFDQELPGYLLEPS